MLSISYTRTGYGYSRVPDLRAPRNTPVLPKMGNYEIMNEKNFVVR